MPPKYKRALLKLSGEALARTKGETFNTAHIQEMGRKIKEIVEDNVQIAIVMGGGNILRGNLLESHGIDRYEADYMGMLATLFNSIALKAILKRLGQKGTIFSPFEIRPFTEIPDRSKAINYLEEGTVVIYAGGLGLPYFSTDTAASLRAVEVEAEVLLKATKVDGVFDRDPILYDNAKKFDCISYLEVIEKNLNFIDTTAISICRDHKIPILVFNLFPVNNVKKVIWGEEIGTLIGDFS